MAEEDECEFYDGVAVISHRTIADIAADYLRETGNDSVMWGDTIILDEIGVRCSHTNLMTLHPLARHQRILNALERSPRFNKVIIDISGRGRGNTKGRCFYLERNHD